MLDRYIYYIFEKGFLNDVMFIFQINKGILIKFKFKVIERVSEGKCVFILMLFDYLDSVFIVRF